jgi:hypothetical protein
MTSLQIVILLCLGCLAAGVIGGGAWMLGTGTGLGPAGPPATATTEPPPTLTPSPTATITLTPSPTEIPYEAYVPTGWQQFINERVELWMAPEFGFQSVEEYNAALVRGFLAVEQGALAAEVEQSPPAYELNFHFLTVEERFGTAIYLRQEALRGEDLAAHIDERFSDLPITLTLVEHKQFELFRARGVRVLLQANYNGSYVGYAYYLVPDGETVWELGCQSVLEDFYSFLPTFDQIAATIRARH